MRRWLSVDGARFDPDALRAKYAQERQRRLRADGISQYVRVAGAFSRFAHDPWADPDFTRDPITDTVDVAVVGAGFGGLLIGARCKQLGVDNVRLIDKAADVGGTWYWNRYPGIACDVESYVYMPLLEELGYVPTEKYAKGAEILAHCRRIAEHYDLYRDACLQTEVHEIRWEPGTSRWVISTDRGDEIRARFVAMANGYLQKPKLPGITGITTFAGHSFHTSRWDYEYTGTDLTDCPISVSASSEPVQRRFSACRGWPNLRIGCSSFSAPRQRSTCGPTGRPNPSGRHRCSPVGSSGAWRTSKSSPRVVQPTRT